MESLGLLVGHLLGDYIFQNDWMAKWKIGGPKNSPEQEMIIMRTIGFQEDERRRMNKANLACTIHCILYTYAVYICSYWWMPLWGLVVCFLTHWVIDRFRLAGFWMRRISGQKEFADGLFSPWSIIVVDNTFHLLTLFFIGVLETR